MRKFIAVLAASLLLLGMSGCGDDDESGGTATGDETPSAEATVVNLTARDYAFDIPATIKGGLVELNYSNAGNEPHFAAFAKAAPGRTFADVKAALMAPPSPTPPPGPPPFEEIAAAAVGDPGSTGKMVFNLPAGTYALFCSLPSPDGTPHIAKGMVSEVTVSEGTDGELPEAVGTLAATDFALSGTPDIDAGKHVVKLRNNGRQLHEINLIELGAGKTVEDSVAWAKEPTGPPPHRFLSGVAVGPGMEGTAEFDFKAGSTYAFVCVIPDVLGDFAPHITKGMFTQSFTV